MPIQTVKDVCAILQHCYLDHLATQEQIDGLLQRSCMPVLSVEIKGGILSVGGFAADEHTLLSEPLRQPVQLYLSNFPQYMLAVAQALAAIRLTLDSLAAEQQHAADTRSSPPELWAGRPWLLCQGQFESWQVQKLWGDTIYLLEPPQTAAGSQSPGTSAAGAQVQPSQLVAKFWQPQGDHALGDLVQAAWHEQGVAPEVVSAPCCPLDHCRASGIPPVAAVATLRPGNAPSDMPRERNRVHFAPYMHSDVCVTPKLLKLPVLPGGHLPGRVLASYRHEIPGARGGLGAPVVARPVISQTPCIADR